LLLLLGCFGGIGVFFLIRNSSSKPATSKKLAATYDVDPNLGQQFPPAGPIGKLDQPGDQKPVPPNLPPVGRPNLPDNPPKKIDPVEQALDDMKSKDLFVRGRAADALAGMQPVHPKRAEVAKAIEKLLQDPETYPRQAAARALPVWATKENLPALIDLLADSFSDKSKIINRLAEFKDERAIKPLADALKNPSTRKTAADALKGFGPKAEDDVIPLLQDRRFAIKQSACDVLKVIGTKKSIAPLQALANERSAIVAKASSP
jgi:HEAT repeat protein